MHWLPGRVRITVPGLLGNPGRAARLEARLAQAEGVLRVQANPATGRVLVIYDPRPAEAPVAAAAETDIALSHQAEPPPRMGLSGTEAARLLRQYGPNTLEAAPRPSFWQRLLEQFKDVMVITLMGGAGISFLLGRVRDALTISAIVALNAVVGASQGGKAEGALDALRRMSAPRATVIRDGRAVAIDAAEVVPGDLLVMEAGDKIPADARIVAATGAQADEALLTGESLPVAKAAASGDDPGGGVGRPDMLFAGTALTSGRCLAVVTATGMRTEMGRIARLLGETREGPTPLQGRMEELGKVLVRGSLLICAGVFGIGLLRGQPIMEMFLTGVSLAVAAIPEGLPTFVTLGLATGVRQMARRKALVRKLQAVETLGSATVICTDKTGTLTANAMTARQIWAGGHWFDVAGSGHAPEGKFTCGGNPVDPLRTPDLAELLRAGALCNNASLQHDGARWQMRGDPTEGALLTAAAKAGLDHADLACRHRRLQEVPFDSGRRRMTVVCEGPDGACIHSKGAPEAVLAVCTHVMKDGRPLPLTPTRRQQILLAADTMAGHAYRVLAAACRPLGRRRDGANPETGLTFLGLFGLMDPPRAEVPRALDRCRRAGIQVIMLTGDHPRTAAAIAAEIGLLVKGDLVLTGDQLARLTERELAACASRLRVCARVSPEQKLHVVRALRSRGHVVAMTGDGVNDAPAVKDADIGIAMGLNGTEVTKEAAGLVLADDNFATIVAAVEQGRVTYNNIRRSIRYLLASNTGEVVLMVASVALGLPLPLIPLQILWLNLVGDGLPALALGAEPGEGTEMEQRPRPRHESVFAGGLGRQIALHGLRMGLAALGLYWWALRSGMPMPVVRTLTLCTLVLGQLIYLWRCRSPRRRPGEPNLTAWAAIASLALLAGSVMLPPLQRTLQLVPLRPVEWAAAGLAGAAGAL